MRRHGALIVGAGGLGIPAALSLARSGVTTLGLMDPGHVELSNLHRQVIFENSDIGVAKVLAAAQRLKEWFPGLRVEPFHCEFNSNNSARISAEWDVIIDATDSPVAKFLINDEAIAAGSPFIYGGVIGSTGQMMTVIPGRSACLRCLFEEVPDEAEVASCRDAGIVGPVAGAIGILQAHEAALLLRGLEPRFAGRMVTYEAARSPRVRVTSVRRRAGCGCGRSRVELSAQATSITRG